jgi:nitrile hydratase accessory protein
VERPLSETTAMTSLRDSSAPAFREPWHAKAFAMVVLLHRQDLLEWHEWVRVLGAEIVAAPQQPGEDPDAAYNRQFLAALERIVAALGIANPDDQRRRKEDWRRAYLNTPHGHAVELAAARSAPGNADDHDQEPSGSPQRHGLAPVVQPIAVSPGTAR